MKRTIVLIRHAKSDWGDPRLRDYDRPLNSRGQRDAPELGRRLHQKGILPDLIVASTARRAAETARAVQEGLAGSEVEIRWEDRLYHCRPVVFEEVLYGLSDACRCVFLVAHNPGISLFAQALLPALPIAEMPTCAAVALQTDAARWQDLPLARNHLLFIDTPKNPA